MTLAALKDVDVLSLTAADVEALPEAQARAILDTWVKALKSELPAALAQSALKNHAKLAKKALYQLQSSGVHPVFVPPAAAATKSEDEASAPTSFPGALTLQLGTGERAFYFAVPRRGGGVDAFQGVLHDEYGITRLARDRTNRNTVRQHLSELETAPGTPVMIVPFSRIQLELGRALTLNERSRTDLDTEHRQALATCDIVPKDPDFAIPGLVQGDLEHAADGAELHDLPEISPWLPSEPDLHALSDSLAPGKLAGLSDAAKLERRKTQVEAQAQRTFTAKVRALYARRLWLAAELVEHHHRPDDAARLRAEARRLVHSNAPSTFAQRLFSKALAT